MIAAAGLAFVLGAAAWPQLGCAKVGCLGGEAGCVVPSPCPRLGFTCSAGRGLAEVAVLEPGDRAPGGLDALAATGDVVLRNDSITVVIDALDHPHYLAPSGGTILDLSTAGADNDSLNNIVHETGLLPGDAAVYTSMELLSGEGFAAVQVRGHLQGDERHRITTRYEVRSCEPGVRVRTELVNLAPDAAIWSLADGFYWGGREALPFTPVKGAGFEHPDFELTSVGDVFRRTPFLAASGHSLPSASYASIACDRDALEGFHAVEVSSVGTERRVVQPRDYVVFERFLAAAEGASISPAADVALEVRRQLFGEEYTTVTGRVVAEDPAALLEGEVRAAIVIFEGDAALPSSERTPWTQVLPATDGRFSARVPRGRAHTVELIAFGRTVATRTVEAAGESAEVEELMLPAVGRVELHTTLDGQRHESLVFILPADAATREATRGRLFGNFTECAPLLGPQHASSPACNRVLTRARVAVSVPPGRYVAYATAGLFATIDRKMLEVVAGGTLTADFALRSLPLLPADVLSADFHVHGAASFDSSIPDTARVLAFLASGIDVIAATDHDVVSDYAAAMASLAVGPRLVLMPGVETTGHILFDLVPGSDIPKVIGHWNFWPLPYLPDRPRNNAPADEQLEPGLLFDAVRAAGLPPEGVIALNHPLSETELGRDLGWARAIELELTKPLPAGDDGTGPGLFFRTPPGATSSNAAYDVQEVMNGTDNDHFLAFRAFWFYLLDQGIVRAGTANSDSHGLTDNVLGTPRNLVFTRVKKESFDVAAFNADVKAGRMIGTNGPILEVSAPGAGGARHGPSTSSFTPDPAGTLRLRVSAAPWVPIDEVRIVVDGVVVKRLTTELARPRDPLATGADALVRFDGELPLASLLPAGNRDAWIVVEAGAPLLASGDLDCDGVPDTGDNNRDGVVDWRDVDEDDDDDVDEADADRNGDGRVDASDAPAPCDDEQEVGPLGKITPAVELEDPYHHFQAVTPGGYPLAFTNPLLLDRDGGGYSGPGLKAREPR